MLSASLFPVLIFFLASSFVGGLMLAAFYPRTVKASAYRQRFERVAGHTQINRTGSADESRDRRRSVEKTLRDIEEQQKAHVRKGRKPKLEARLRQAGLGWSTRAYWVACAGTGLAIYVLVALLGLGAFAALGFATAGGLYLPHFHVNTTRNRRLKRFTAEFPNAVDVIVRGLKAGLPMTDCLRVIAAEAQEPVKGEFLTIAHDQTLGLPVDEAVERLCERMPLPEARFFAIVITIQSRTGGSLSEALGNLSKVLRERKKMKAKIKAMSAEAKSSAGIIGALPFFVAGAVYLTSPDYMSLLFTTMTGKMVLVGSALWMGIGTLLMRKMINFDF
ncbi:pilus assembly protein TadB (plasmid) [Sinorhizobium fredii NGR234]|uniref:Pilus assembly protein TadB n=1 Tax=Sinorhizobium fredii (strain NBRC 101917 / NGR234) TaxID=394 RepID=Q6W1R7_SINFN|nr:type II secretion system F family protein [Sinorhizobium fredii]AAQ87301.1 TadB-like protein involved in pilus formation and/or protein secretion [Sinorhizobium fredii NGR234]ACP21838.1 pilus assembly protein TadB [Sinorhizobium fredii NGR234]